MPMGSAARIAGLTIEINGDTTGLSKALQGVNKEISSCQSTLRDVDRALKLDPGNLDLLKAKQKALNDEIAAAKDKLDKEKQALEQLKNSDGFDANSRQAKDLETQIALDESALKSLTDQAEKFGSVGKQSLMAAGEQIKSVGTKMSDVGKSLTTAVTVPIVGVATAAVKTTADFDASMSKVKAITGATGDEFEMLRGKAIEMGGSTKFSVSEAADAMTYMGMAGWKTGDIIDGIAGVMNLAAASGEDLATTSDIVTDAMTAFGMSAEESGHFADILAAASVNANTNVSMLGESFKYAAPVAGALGYSAEDVSIALGLMANAGIKASQGGTALRNILQSLVDPTDKNKAAMERLGISLQDDEGRMYSFREIMEQLRAGFGQINMPVEEFNQKVAQLDQDLADGTITQNKYDAALEELIKQAYGAEGAEKARTAAMLAGKTGMSGLLAIVNASQEDWDNLTSAVDGCSDVFVKTVDGSIIPMSQALEEGVEWTEEYNGVAEQMAAVMQDNLMGKFTELGSKVQALAVSFGDIMMPAIEKVTDVISGLVDWLNNLDDGQKQTIVTIASVVAAVGPVLLIAGKIITGIGSVVSAVGACSGAFGALAGVLTGPVGIAVSAAVAGGVLLWQNWDKVKEFASQLGEKISNVWNGIKEKTSSIWNDVSSKIGGKWDEIKKKTSETVDNVKETASKRWEELKQVTATVYPIIAKNIADKWSEAKQKTSEAVENMKKGVSEKWESIKTKTSEVWSNLTSTIQGKWADAKQKTTTAVEGIKSSISDKWEFIKSRTTSVFGDIKTAISSKLEEARNTVGNIIQAIREKFNFKWELPKLKMPHVAISGSFSLNPPSVPKFSIDWYAKAMKNGMILNSPTIFGQMGNHLLAGGEAGSEAVVGTKSLMQMIQTAVNAAGQTTNYGGVNIVVYGAPGQDVSELADIISARINAQIARKGAAFA